MWLNFEKRFCQIELCWWFKVCYGIMFHLYVVHYFGVSNLSKYHKIQDTKSSKNNITNFGIQFGKVSDRGFSKRNHGSLPAWQKGLNVRSDSYFWNHKFRNKDHFNIKIFLPGWQAARILFWKTSIVLRLFQANPLVPDCGLCRRTIRGT